MGLFFLPPSPVLVEKRERSGRASAARAGTFQYVLKAESTGMFMLRHEAPWPHFPLTTW